MICSNGPRRLSLSLDRLFSNYYLPLRLAGGSRKTIAAYQTAVNHWTRLVGSLAVSRIDTKRFAMFQRRLLADVGAASTNTYCRHLMVLLHFAADEEVNLIGRAPKWSKLKEPKRTPLALTVEEFATVLETAQNLPGTIAGYSAAEWWTALLLVCWETGLRYSALLMLLSVDVVWDSSGLYCQAEPQKDKEAMWFDLPPNVLDAIRAIYDPQRELLFPRDVTVETVGRWFREILDASGVYAPKGCGMRFHRIRKSKASYTEALGGNPTQALGHSARSVTERYLDPRIVKPVKQPFMPSPVGGSSARPQLRICG
ncbi:MAG: tyrosine-type recombinase/integrase [Thermoguttaceae bacterium]